MATEYVDNQVAVAHLRNTRIPPRKARFVVDLIRGKRVADAMALLGALNRPSAAPQIERLLKAAVSGVNTGEHPDPQSLTVGRAWVNGGTIIKRWRPRAMGRGNRIRKRTCHVTLVLTAGAPGV